MICQALKFEDGYAIMWHGEPARLLNDFDGNIKKYPMYHQALNKISSIGCVAVSKAGEYQGLMLMTSKVGTVYVLAGDTQVFTDKHFRTLNDAKEMIDHHLPQIKG